MATGADTLRSINQILQSGERREQRKVDTALAMMQLAASQESSKARESLALQQFAQTARMQEIGLVQSNLQTSLSLLESQKPKITSAFVTASGLSRYYQEAEEGEMADDAITDMAKELSKKMGKGYDNQASEFAGALFNYYTAKDSESMLNIATSLHDATQAINADTATAQQRKLFEAFRNLGATAELEGVSGLAKKARISEQRISKEFSEFLQGDYEIQDPIGIYADIPEIITAPPPIDPIDPITTSTSLSEDKVALNNAKLKLESLEKKVNAGIATDEEKEEFLTLPIVIKQYRVDLYNATGEYESELSDEVEEAEKQMDEMYQSGFQMRPEYRALKNQVSQKKAEIKNIISDMRREIMSEKQDIELEGISDITGIPIDELRRQRESRKEALEEAQKDIRRAGGMSQTFR
tara:strand:+ start:653 stop:1888 length:1236 start_codon:yes stop_codon:yes gene_type:complete